MRDQGEPEEGGVEVCRNLTGAEVLIGIGGA